jgi:glycosyltransferase involved in cell wall biosynthesis
VQLGALLLLADRRFASIEPWAQKFSRIRPTAHLPSGSTLPNQRPERQSVRRELGLEGAFVVATLSTGHPSHMTNYVEGALARLDEKGLSTVFLRLGAGAASVTVPRRIRCEHFGFLPAERLAALLAASDLVLTPFVDGVSTRRTSFMAGLCQEVAVLGTRGVLTDPMLIDRGLELVDVGRADAFADHAVELAIDSGRRARAASAGRMLFDAEFTWDAIANRLLDAIGEA